MHGRKTITVGELVERLLERYRARLGDTELARLMTAAVVNELLARQPVRGDGGEGARAA